MSEDIIRKVIEELETDYFDFIFPAEVGSGNTFQGERRGLYFALGERTPPYTPVYMFEHYRKATAGGAV